MIKKKNMANGSMGLTQQKRERKLPMPWLVNLGRVECKSQEEGTVDWMQEKK